MYLCVSLHYLISLEVAGFRLFWFYLFFPCLLSLLGFFCFILSVTLRPASGHTSGLSPSRVKPCNSSSPRPYVIQPRVVIAQQARKLPCHRTGQFRFSPALLGWPGARLLTLLGGQHVSVCLLPGPSLLNHDLVCPGNHRLDHALVVGRQLGCQSAVELWLFLLQSCSQTVSLVLTHATSIKRQASANLLIIVALKSW